MDGFQGHLPSEVSQVEINTVECKKTNKQETLIDTGIDG